MNAQQGMTGGNHLSKFGVIAAQACIVLAGVYQCYMCMPLQEPTRTVRTARRVHAGWSATTKILASLNALNLDPHKDETNAQCK